MPAIERYFFTPVYFPRSRWTVLAWWESRRPLYNAAVGLTGLATLGAVLTFAVLPPRPIAETLAWDPILRLVVVYGVMANLCYSLGAPVDLLLRQLFGQRAGAAGPVLFRYGFVFSLGLTLLPIPLAAIGWVLRVLFP